MYHPRLEKYSPLSPGDGRDRRYSVGFRMT
jgi:hypothetical protein